MLTAYNYFNVAQLTVYLSFNIKVRVEQHLNASATLIGPQTESWIGLQYLIQNDVNSQCRILTNEVQTYQG